VCESFDIFCSLALSKRSGGGWCCSLALSERQAGGVAAAPLYRASDRQVGWQPLLCIERATGGGLTFLQLGFSCVFVAFLGRLFSLVYTVYTMYTYNIIYMQIYIEIYVE